MPVCIRVNGQPGAGWRVNLMPVGNGSFYLYLHGRVRAASGTRVGDLATIELEFDPNYASGPAAVPEWFRAALKRRPKALRAWTDLIPSRQKEIIRYLAQLKSAEARKRNLAGAVSVLGGKKTRFMARAWNQ